MRAFWIIIALLIAATAALFFTGGRDSDEPDTQPVADHTQQTEPEPIAPSSPPAAEAPTDQPAPAQPEAAQPEAPQPAPEQSEPAPSEPAQPEPIAHSSALDALKQAITNPNQNADPQPGTNMPRPADDTTENQTGPGTPITGSPASPPEDADPVPAPEPADQETEPAPAEPETPTAEPAPASPTAIAPDQQPRNTPAATPAATPEPKPAAKPEPVVKTDTGLLLDGHWNVPGSGTKADPYTIDWDMLVAVQQDYKPRLGQDKIPEWIETLNGKTVTIRGYALLPTGMSTLSELLVMLNEWDSCCIGVPPTPYDAIEVRLAKPLNNSAKSMFSHTGALSFGDITGTFKIDPYIVQGWLLGLYLMEDASAQLHGPAGTP